jgi:membrane protein DedA with SNARE-associated domain
VAFGANFVTPFFWIALATFGSEDLTCIAVGALIAKGKISFVEGAFACIAGIWIGDLLLYFAGRTIGRPIVRWRVLRKILTVEKLDRASAFLAERGAGVVILSRFTPGLRLPTYIAAGALKTHFWTFAAYFLFAAILWTPALIGASALLGKRLPHLAYFCPAVLLVGAPLRRVPLWRAWRRALGWIRRRIQWEFWPPWLAYLPLAPYILYLGIRRRSLTVFTAANPGIPSGGFVGESKSAILSRLPHVPEFMVLENGMSIEGRLVSVRHFIAGRNLAYPVVLKPDVGERGRGVRIARCEREVRRYLETATGRTIVQRYVEGLEFGVYYCRYPGEACGRIFSITEKRLPAITGDGSSSIVELILADPRAVCLANLYVSRLRRSPDEVPAAGEVVPIAELGSHCLGAVFLNGAHLETAELRVAVDEVARAHPGFFMGRFDLRTPSLEDFKAGRFEVLELNGVSAEPAHIYDPSVSLLDAYGALCRHWKMALEIGAINRAAGAEPMSIPRLLRLRKQHR